MSQFERIDQILEDTIPFFRANEERSPHYADLIRKAMEQYGKEQYKQGCINIIKANEELDPDILKKLSNARQLIQAQKEYILWLQVHAKELTADEVDTAFNFKDKIEKLEQ